MPEEDWSLPVEAAVAPLRVEDGRDHWASPPLRTTRSSEFDRISALRADRASVRSEPEFRDFVTPVERASGKLPPPLPAHSVSAAAAVPPPIAVAPPIIAAPKVAANVPRPEITSAKPAELKPAELKAERSVLFDDADDLADLFNKFDLGKN